MKKQHLRPAFTLIEVLVSVLIISGSIVYALQIHSQNHAQILYVSERGKLSLQDSLFVADTALAYHKSEKEAYDVISRYFRIDDLKSREVLKKISREYYIPDPIQLTSEEESTAAGVPSAVIEEIKIKDKYSSSYFHFKINSF